MLFCRSVDNINEYVDKVSIHMQRLYIVMVFLQKGLLPIAAMVPSRTLYWKLSLFERHQGVHVKQHH